MTKTTKYKNLYVAATSQHVGKTTSTLGLASAFRRKGVDIGYCKPVGQRYVIHNNLQVDKDVVLFADLLGFEIDPALHSPVILGSGTTADFLENPQDFNFAQRLRESKEAMNAAHELTIFEGTGHPGVGSVVNLSNADVAKTTDCSVLMVAEGGIGSTIDMVSMCMEKFYRLDVPIMGLILNKVLPDKREKVEYYVKKWLEPLNIPLLGSMPFDKSMGFPTLTNVIDSVKGKMEMNSDYKGNIIEGFIAGSLISPDEMKGKRNLLLVVGATRLDLAIKDTISVMRSMGMTKPPFSGIISTGVGKYTEKTINFIKKNQIPLIHTDLETYGAVQKISRIEVKINQQTPWKVSRAIEMIESNIDLDYILNTLKVNA